MSTADKQLKLGQKKKVKAPPITERTEIDTNSWVLPDDLDLIKEAIELSEFYQTDGNNTFYLLQNKMQWDFIYTDNTLLCTSYPCCGCGKKHNASIDRETAVITQQCLKSNAIFLNTPGKKAVQVHMICPTCEKMGITVDYSTWRTLSDKTCAECQQETAAAKETQRKKSKKLLKEGDTTAQPTPETSINEVAEAIEKLVPEAKEELPGKLYLGKFKIIDQDFGSDIKRLDHPDIAHNAHYYLTTKRNLIDAMQVIFAKLYHDSYLLRKRSQPVHIMNYHAFESYQVTAEKFTAGYDKNVHLDFTQLNTDNWLYQLFPDFEYPSDYFKTFGVMPSEDTSVPKKVDLNKTQEESPRGDKTKNEKKDSSLKQDNGTREGLPESFDKKQDSPRGESTSTQINLDKFCTMLINTDKLIETDFQFREELDKEHIKLLAESIKAFGKNIEAIIVRQLDDGQYEIISGHHRVAAAKKAKVKFVKCEVIDATDKESLEISFTTNLTQKAMSPLEESHTIKKYQELSPELTQQDIAKKFGKSHQWVSFRLSLLEAPTFAQQKLAEEKITASHIEAVSGLPSEEQESIIIDAARQKLSVRDTEKLVKEKKRKHKLQEELEAAYADLELYLNDHLDELKEKRISSTEIWNADDETLAKYYDQTVDNILEKLSLNEYEKPLYNWEYGESREKVLGLFAKVGLKLIDGSDLHDAAEEVETEIKKKSNLCEDCDVPKKFLETRYCPFSEDLSKPKTKCDYVWESYYGDDDEKFPKAAKKICYICRKEFSEDDFTRRQDDFGRRVHMSCYHEKLVEQGFINYVVCEDKYCKRKGCCSLQDELFKNIQRLDHPVVIDLMNCEYFKDPDEEDKLTLVKRSWYYTLFDDYGSSVDAGESLEAVAQFLKEKGIDAPIIIAKTPKDQKDLDKILELLKAELETTAAKDSSEKEGSS